MDGHDSGGDGLLVLWSRGRMVLLPVIHHRLGSARSILQLAAYTIAGIVAASPIRLPGVNGTLSMNYAVILAALLNIDLPSAMIVAVVSTLGQSMIHAVL